jgi:hypothetical protein
MPETRAAEEKRLNVFISYSRKDIVFAQRVVAELEARGVAPKIDTRDLPKLEDWRRELLGFIREADAVVFIVSPNSILSPVCAWEVEQVANLNKRLAPIVVERVADDRIPEAISKVNYLFFDSPNEFEAQADALAQALKTNLPWLKEHTRLGELARRWDERKNSSGLLLRGQELQDAEQWIASRPRDAPDSTELHREFIAQSRRGTTRRQRLTVAGSLVAAVVAVGLAGFAYWQRSVAVEQTKTAVEQQRAAEQQRALAEAANRRAQEAAAEASLRERAARAAAAIPSDPESALEIAITALEENRASGKALLPEVHAAAWRALDASRRVGRIRSQGVFSMYGTRAIVPSPDSTKLLVVTQTFVLLIDRNGHHLAEPIWLPEVINTYANAAAWRPSGSHFVIVSGDNSKAGLRSAGVRLYAADGTFVRSLLGAEEAIPLSVAFADADRIAVGLSDGRLVMLDLSGRLLDSTRFSTRSSLSAVALFESWQRARIVAAEGDQPTTASETHERGDAAGGPPAPIGNELLPTTVSPGTRCLVASPQHDVLAQCGSDGIVTLWQDNPTTQRLERLRALRGHIGAVHAAAFHPSGRIIATAGADGDIRLWSPEGRELTTPLRLSGARIGERRAIAFLDGGNELVSDCGDELCIWDLQDLAIPRELPRYDLVATQPGTGFALLGTNFSDNRTSGWQILSLARDGTLTEVRASDHGKLRALAVGAVTDTYAFATDDVLVVGRLGAAAQDLWRRNVAQITGEMVSVTFARHDNALLMVRTRLVPKSAAADGTALSSADLQYRAIFERYSVDSGRIEAQEETSSAQALDSVAGNPDEDGPLLFTRRTFDAVVEAWDGSFARIAATDSISGASLFGNGALRASNGLVLSGTGSEVDLLDRSLKSKAERLKLASEIVTSTISPAGLIAIALKDRSISIRDTRGGELFRLTAVEDRGFDWHSSLDVYEGQVRLTISGATANWDLSPATLARRGRARLTVYADEKRLAALEAKLDRAYKQRSYAESIADAKIAAELEPTHAINYVTLGNFIFWSAKSMADVAPAEESYSKAIEQLPYLQMAYFQRGKLRSWLGRFADADHDFTSAIRYRQFILPIPVVIAKFVPGVEESVRNSLEALRLAGEDSYLRRALVRRKLGHWQGVLEDLQQQSHNLLIVPTLKAEALLQLGRSEEAMTTALAAEERFRETADIYAYDEIEAEARKPGERDSKRADLLEIAATAADRMGQAERARDLIVACRLALEKVLSAQPGNQAVRGRLSRLGQEPKHAN